MAKSNSIYDVYIAYEFEELETAKYIANSFRALGLTVFLSSDAIAPGARLEDVVWEAMADSYALVVVLPKSVSSAWMAFELGAAKAWNKPVFAVSNPDSVQIVPQSLREVQVLPLSRINEIGDSIVQSMRAVDPDEQKQLSDAYEHIGISVDQLTTQPTQLAKLVKEFNKVSGRRMEGEQVMWHLLRLRKQGKLSPLKKRDSHA